MACDPCTRWTSCPWGTHWRSPYPTQRPRLPVGTVSTSFHGPWVAEMQTKLHRSFRPSPLAWGWLRGRPEYLPCLWPHPWWAHTASLPLGKPLPVLRWVASGERRRHVAPDLAEVQICSLSLSMWVGIMASKIFDVGPEEVAQTHEGPDCLDIRGWSCILDCLQFVFPWLDSFWCEGKSQVGNLLVSEYTFLQVDLEMVLVQAC